MRFGTWSLLGALSVAGVVAVILNSGADVHARPSKSNSGGAGASAPAAEGGVAGGSLPLRTTRVASGLTLPIYAASPNNDYQRLFIAEKTGRIKILNLNTGAVLATPFLNLDPVMGGSATENFGKGIMGIAFDPDYQNNGFIYVHYYLDPVTTGRLSRFTVSAADANVADPLSEFVVFQWTDSNNDHNGGSIDFGPDGLLYMTMGDGGTQNDPENDAQNVNNILGKILRFDVHGGDDFPADATRNFHVPPGNPFALGGGEVAIWHFGFRNPYRASFDMATGNYYVGDVGQNTREEIDVIHHTTSGLNFGWRCIEGTFVTGLTGCSCVGPACVAAAHEYPDATQGRSVTGGYVYRGCAIPALVGQYLFADYTSNNMWRGTYNGTSLTSVISLNSQLQTTIDVPAVPVAKIAAFAQDSRGELYMVRHAAGGGAGINGGEIYKIVLQTPVTSPADLNCDSLVNGIDLGTMLSAWTLPPATACQWGQCLSDLNHDGRVDGVDLGILLADWTL